MESRHENLLHIIKLLLLSLTSLEVFQGTEIPAYPSTSNEGIADEVSDWHEAIKERGPNLPRNL